EAGVTAGEDVAVGNQAVEAPAVAVEAVTQPNVGVANAKGVAAGTQAQVGVARLGEAVLLVVDVPDCQEGRDAVAEAVPTLDAGVPKAVIPVGEQLRGLVADEYVAAGFGVATLVAHHAGQVGIAHPPGAVEGHAGVGAIHLGAGDVDVSVDFASGDGGAHDRLAPWHVDASGDLVLVVLGVGVPVALVFTL